MRQKRRGERARGPLVVNQHERVELRPQKPGVLPAPLKIVLIANANGQLHGGRQTISISTQLPNRAPNARRVEPGNLRLPLLARRVQQAGQVVMHAHAMRAAFVISRTQNGVAMRVLCQPGCYCQVADYDLRPCSLVSFR